MKASVIAGLLIGVVAVLLFVGIRARIPDRIVGKWEAQTQATIFSTPTTITLEFLPDGELFINDPLAAYEQDNPIVFHWKRLDSQRITISNDKLGERVSDCYVKNGKLLFTGDENLQGYFNPVNP